ncbi:major facilitator superfamily domain-containing protein [Paraphoma chrysanthemicola]|uniref:Major facilitator superfamily domain-containing protein n=1 Tax=Paraphoma chrysanthemicola TaxID=798071 RepID=A0A8K0R909_9PLEO|nr:major facilitator superfamily domain-containing protein [Paraphoma chrysanthemicola]
MAIPDEEQPLLRTITEEDVVKHTGDEVILDFDPFDPEDPRNWSEAFKWCIVLLLACMAFTVTFTCIGIVPIAPSIVSDLSGHSSTSSTTALLVTIWELGEAAGPLLIAPLSEVLGRYPVMNGCNIFFIIWTLLAASSQSTNVFIAARMLTGLAVASNVLNPAIIGDMFESEKRGSAMSLIMLAPLIGGAVGPAIGGAIAQTLGWREMLLIAAGLAVLCEILFLTCFRETYKMAVLRKRLRKLQRESGEFRNVTKTSAREDVMKLWHSITRPFSVLFGSSVLMAMSIFAAVAFSYFYVMCISFPQVLQEVYGFTPAQTGSSFMTFSVGSFLAVFVCNFGLDRIYIKLRGFGKGKPEYRLPLSIIGAFTLPISITVYGWVAQLHLPIPLLLASVSLLGFTLLLTVIPLSAYVVDACGLYSASAMTGVIVTRCLAGTFLPLGTGPLVERFGYGWGFTSLGACSLSLAIIPVLILRHGEKWRQRSEFTRDV